jgi:hypothetical protein
VYLCICFVGHTGCCSRRGELAIQDQVAGMPSAAQAALPTEIDGGALSKSVAADKETYGVRTCAGDKI